MDIYFDYAATTPVDPQVTKTMFDWQNANFGNPSSPHRVGQKSKIKLEDSRDMIADELGCLSKEIVFTSGGTESNNQAIAGFCLANMEKGKHVITTSVEHPSVLKTFDYLGDFGFETTLINPEKDGSIDLKKLENLITPETILISMMYVNNETGVIFPVEEVAEICKKNDVVFHSDAVQAFGKMDIKAESLFDLLSFSAHKIYGPKGVGGLYVRDGIAIETRSYGGGQEANKRPGTENLTGIIGFGKALEQMNDKQQQWNNIEYLKKMFEDSVLSRIENTMINGIESNRSPYISNISFLGVDNQSLLLNLDMQGVAASVGSACSSGSIKQSHVLQGMHLPQEQINSAIRFSFGRFTKEKEIVRAVEVLENLMLRLRL